MNEKELMTLKNSMIAIGHLLWEKDLVHGLNGNISARMDDQTILMTSHGSCLGMLKENDLLRISVDGDLLDEGNVSTEKLLHCEVYRSFPKIKAVIHTHPTFTNAYFLNHEHFKPQILEAQLSLGSVQGVAQKTPAVTQADPIIKALKLNNIVALRRHGVVAAGEQLFDCFLLIEALEQAVKVNAISRLFEGVNLPERTEGTQAPQKISGQGSKRFPLFSREQIEEIVATVNEDPKMKELGRQTKMTMDLAVKLDETGQVYSFHFNEGNIDRVGNDEDVEFLINAPEIVWRAVFNQEIDPFVATTQKKMRLRGDFAKISKWYAPCSRVFELWSLVPVE